MWRKSKPYLFFVALSVGVGALSSLLTKDGMAAYEAAAKSSLTPPSFVFPIVWTILFVLMGVGAAMVWRTRSAVRGNALLCYGVQLVVNFFWSIIFFNMRAYLFALIWLILLWGLIAAMTALFFRARKTAGLLQIPYLAWVAFAGYLNGAIWLLNR